MKLYEPDVKVKISESEVSCLRKHLENLQRNGYNDCVAEQIWNKVGGKDSDIWNDIDDEHIDNTPEFVNGEMELILDEYEAEWLPMFLRIVRPGAKDQKIIDSLIEKLPLEKLEEDEEDEDEEDEEEDD